MNPGKDAQPVVANDLVQLLLFQGIIPADKTVPYSYFQCGAVEADCCKRLILVHCQIFDAGTVHFAVAEIVIAAHQLVPGWLEGRPVYKL